MLPGYPEIVMRAMDAEELRLSLDELGLVGP